MGLSWILLSQGYNTTDALQLIKIALLVNPQSLGIWNTLQLEDIHLAALENADALIFLGKLNLVEQICLRTFVNDDLLKDADDLVNILLHPLSENSGSELN